MDKVFSIAVFTRGRLQTSFVLEDEETYKKWRRDALPLLEKEYGKLKLKKELLPELQVGDKCHVYGEGADVFTIVSLSCIGNHRWVFLLDSGDVENVSKCFKVKEK